MERKPGKIMLILTNKCNLNCVYCYEDQKYNGRMNFETAICNIEKVLENDRYSEMDIYLFGGEPFLEFDLVKKICEWTWNKKWSIPYKFTVSTNGTTLREKEKEWLRKNREKMWVVLSLDGNKFSHDINRSNSFDLIDLEFFRENWPESGIKMTISEKTLPFLYENIKYIHSKGLKFSECNLAMGIDWSSEENIFILKTQLEQLLDFYIDNPELEPAHIINMNVGGCENNKEILKICGAGEITSINTDGKNYPCNYINPMCFKDEELKELMNLDFEKLEELEDMNCFKECYIYPLCPNCYAANYSVNGKANERDKSVCKLIKLRAYYSAKLTAYKIKNTDIENLSVVDKGKIHKTIVALGKILEMYADIA